MRAIEFYMTPKGEVILKEEGKPEHQLKETDYDFISSFLNVIEEFYPDAYKKLMEEYARSEKRRTYRDFLAVRRFIKCNMFINSSDGLIKPFKMVAILRGRAKLIFSVIDSSRSSNKASL